MVVGDAFGRAGFERAAAQLGVTVGSPRGTRRAPGRRRIPRPRRARFRCARPGSAAQLSEQLGQTELELGIFGGARAWRDPARARARDQGARHLRRRRPLAPRARSARQTPTSRSAAGEIVVDGRWTGNLGAITTEPCPCGRGTARLRLLPRSCIRLDSDGGPVFPSQDRAGPARAARRRAHKSDRRRPAGVISRCTASRCTCFLDGPALADQVLTALRERLGLDPVRRRRTAGLASRARSGCAHTEVLLPNPSRSPP